MAFLIALALLYGIILLINDGKRSSQKKLSQLYTHNNQRGQFEYILSWYIFWEEVVPEVYSKGTKAWPEYVKRHVKTGVFLEPNIVGIYDHAFEELGFNMYGRDPVDESVVRARTYLATMGIPRYTKEFYPDPKMLGYANTIDHLNAKPDEYTADIYRRPDIIFLADSRYPVTVNYHGRVLAAPNDDDYRVWHFIYNDGKTIGDLWNENIGSIHKWRTPKEQTRAKLEADIKARSGGE